MDKIVIQGGQRLTGSIRINGAKNAALLAVAFIARFDPEIAKKLSEFREAQSAKVPERPSS